MRNDGLVLLAVVLLLSSNCAVVSHTCPHGWNWLQESHSKEVIIQFHHYKSHADLSFFFESHIANSFPSTVKWGIKFPVFTSVKYPTDFLVLSVPSLSYGRVVQRLKQQNFNKFIKNVAANVQYDTQQLLQWGDGRRKATANDGKIFLRSLYNEKDRELQGVNVVEQINASALWRKGFTGKGVKIAVFDTGMNKNQPYFKNVKERTNWTKDRTMNDQLGHGTFVAGVIAGTNEKCPGIAPDAELYVFRVFTDQQASFTSWFLDAFNYALFLGIHVLNLSIGGPDFHDQPFVDKIRELSANKVIIVSAIGNDGPLYGTLNNPADQLDVVGVGGLSRDNNVAKFSSRGMSTWEIQYGYGRVKPDILAPSESIRGQLPGTSCRSISGTSVSSPVVAGSIALLISSVPEKIRPRIINAGSIKQALIATANRLSPQSSEKGEFINHIFEQGPGVLNIMGAADFLKKLVKSFQSKRPVQLFSSNPYFTPSFFPSSLDFTDCPYMWPHCMQPVYADALPILVNATVINPGSVTSYISDSPEWIPGINGQFLNISTSNSKVIWPYIGYLGIYIRISKVASAWKGVAEGKIKLHLRSREYQTISIYLKIRLNIVPTPPKSRRLLWDQFHNIQYPSPFVPRDNLHDSHTLLDWTGDHLHTNFHELWNFLRGKNFFIEILSHDFTCVKLENYGCILLIDPEEQFYKEEVEVLHDSLKHKNVSLVVFAEWYNVGAMKRISFFDTNTLSNWLPITGGSNLPALNSILRTFQISFGSRIWTGNNISFSDTQTLDGGFPFLSGSHIVRFPKSGIMLNYSLVDRTEDFMKNEAEKIETQQNIPILGLYQIPSPKGGRIVVFGDTSCIDSNIISKTSKNCFDMMHELILYGCSGQIPDAVVEKRPLAQEFISTKYRPTLQVLDDNELWKYSKVLRKDSEYGRCDYS